MHRVLLPLLLLLTACANVAGDKYPYPPQFVDVPDIGMNALPSPPAVGSKTHKREIAHILSIQAQMSEAEKARVMHEDKIIPEMIVLPVLGSHYTRENYPALYTLLGHAASDAWRIGDATQEHWNRTRPWLIDKQVQLFAKPITRPSYPSGHSTTNHVWAHVLSELFPSKREALFRKAFAIGSNRMKGGVHFPSDVSAGKQIAAKIFNRMRGNSEFQAELRAAREELSYPQPANDNTPKVDAAMMSR